MKSGYLRKITGIVITGILTLGLLAGCGQAAATTTTEATPAQETQTEEAKEEAKAEETKTEEASSEEKTKVGLILSGSISDGSWNGGAYDGLTWLSENRDDVETTYVENTSVDDSKLIIQNLIDEGYTVIIAFASEYSDVIDEIAAENPNVYFVDTNTYGTGRPANVTALNGNQGEGAFLVGVIAGSLSQTGKIGSVEGFDFGDLSDNYVNFVAGAQYINPDIETVVSYVGSWTDVEKSKQTALAQIESGVDFIYSSGDLIGVGVIAACEEADVPVVGYGSDLNELAPNQVVTTVNWNSGITFSGVIDSIKSGNFATEVINASLADGSIFLADYHGLLDEDTQKKVEEVKEGIISGEIKTGK